MLAHAIPARPRPDMATEVVDGLTRPGQKELPSKYFYDEVGSALFEAISVLPEYGLTAADERLLRAHASEIVERLEPPVTVAELGSGSGRKTRWILEALGRRHPTTYCPIEISPAALARCERELGQLKSISILGFERSYLDGLRRVGRLRRPGDRLLVLFLGSTIGNFDRDASDRFLADVRARMRPGDALLMGTDLVKPVETLLLAYHDPAGVTAAFNLNLLARINRELGADFDLPSFRHVARWDAKNRRIEMHLRSTKRQVVTIPAADLTVTLAKGETIWTESSHKYEAEEISQVAARTGFACERQFSADMAALAS